jgi:membrane protease YdiL (CAAX protease family)
VFDPTLYLLLVLASLPGIWVASVRQARILQPYLAHKMGEEQAPSPSRMAFVSGTQVLVLVVVAAALGTGFAPRVGLRAPFFEALSSGHPAWPAMAPQLVPALTLGVGGAAVLLALYYGLFRRWLDPQTVRLTEALRIRVGFANRVLFGGIVEEVLFRWGVMSFVAWVGVVVTSGTTPESASGAASLDPAIFWTANAVAGIVFGLGHLPGVVGVGIRVTRGLLATAILLNLWAGLVFGWLFWRYGLLAAMLAHALFHIVWLPIDHAVTARDARRARKRAEGRDEAEAWNSILNRRRKERDDGG